METKTQGQSSQKRSTSTRPPARGGAGRGGDSRGGGRGDRKTFADKPKPEFDQKILNIRRVTRVVTGGRRMSFAVAMVIGDKKGSVGLGTGKAIDTALAINKAIRSARKTMIKIRTTKSGSIAHEVEAKFCSSRVMMMPNRGRGLVAGSSTRDILMLAGLKDITSKIHSGSKNKLNNARATMKALALVADKRHLAEKETAPAHVSPAGAAEKVS